MPGVSTAPAVKVALQTLFLDSPDLGAHPDPKLNVKATYGFRTRDVQAESIVLGRVEWDSEKFAAVGALRREENYWIYLYVWVNTADKTQREVTERAFEILGFIELLLQQKPNILGMGISGVNWQELEPITAVEAPSGEGFQTMVEARIKVKARK